MFQFQSYQVCGKCCGHTTTGMFQKIVKNSPSTFCSATNALANKRFSSNAQQIPPSSGYFPPEIYCCSPSSPAYRSSEVYSSVPSPYCPQNAYSFGQSSPYSMVNNNTGYVSAAQRYAPAWMSMTNPFTSSLLSSYNYSGPVMGRTENNSPTFKSSGNHCLDFFFHVVPDTPAEQVTSRLKAAWDQDPTTALKLVCNLRAIRGTGKSDREGFYAAALWLHENHPKTLAGNVRPIADFGYFKDLLEILHRLLKGPAVRVIEKDKLFRRRNVYGYTWWQDEEALKKEGIKTMLYKEQKLEAARKATEKYNIDPTYRLLHNQVSQLFAEHLKSDLEKLKSGKLGNISLAAKWCPSLDSSYDKSTLICESIAKRLFRREEYPEYEELEEPDYVYMVRHRLRKDVYGPLRRALQLPEVLMSAQEWSKVVYPRVSSKAMRRYTEIFMMRDPERFHAYLESVKEGKQKIAAGGLLPHEIVERVQYYRDEVAELQWNRIVEDLSKLGKLKNCLAICDVSGSMEGTPLEVSIALGLLVSELSEEPWKGKLITFSRLPQLQVIIGDDLHSKRDSIARMDWQMNTDFQKVFDKILEVAVEGKLTGEQMIQRLFVFSDMEFDVASANDWETDYQAIVRKFNEKGFSRVPEIVFWNLRNSEPTPVPSHQKGVALVSGFSKNMLKLFLEEGGILDPVKTMEAAIAGKEYEKLVVLD